MKIGLDTPLATCLLAATLLAGCAAPAGSEHAAPAGQSTNDGSPSKSVMTEEEVRDLNGQPPEERRRRVDIVLASHPDDLGALFARVDADSDLKDFPAVLADSEAALANSTLSPRLRRLFLVSRAEALIQVRRPAEALVAADQALAIDDSNPNALFARGWARYLTDNNLAQSALADLDRALQLEPDQGIAYYRRALIFEYQGKFDLATADLEHASQLAPDDRPIRQEFASLLFTEWYSGQFRQSIASFREQATRPEASSYAPLWLFIMRTRASPADEAAAKAELATLAPAHRPHEWVDTLIDLMLGKSTLEAALSEADTAPTDKLRAGQRCEAGYYVAEQLLAHGQDMQASRLLDEAQAVCPSTYIEAKAIVAQQRQFAARPASR
jgi:lipoprotein NlpI